MAHGSFQTVTVSLQLPLIWVGIQDTWVSSWSARLRRGNR